MARRLRLVVLVAALVLTVLPSVATADHAASPASATLVGSLQDELGCPGDWDPACATTGLAFDADDDVWQASFNIPAGSFEYKVALNGTWDAAYPGANVPLALGAATDVKFYYDDDTHWVADDVNSVIATAAGSFQGALGCPADWDPSCLQSWLQDPDGDGIYEFVTTDIPVGSYEFKVALDEDWTTSYPASNVPFTVADAGDQVTVTYDSVGNAVSVDVSVPPPPGPASVALVGDFQDELGCPGDWQPECASTEFTREASDGVWQATHTIPAGSWNYKAALNDSWDVSYPADNIPLDIGAATDVKFYFDDVTTWVTDNVNSVIATAPGSFQSELGCPGDWQPDCLISWLQDMDGDGVYEFTSDAIPVGSYEFKVALDEEWTTSYPAGNVPFTVAEAGHTVTITYDAATNEVSVDAGGPTIEPGDELLVRPSVRHPVQDNVFYFVMPDRFENGDPSNDEAGDLSGDPLVHGYLPTDKGYYHGGDLAGLEARLPYLDALGIDAIWMTPMFTNRWVQGDGTIGGSSSGYHGYWQIDYSSIDPHFGTNAEMQDFVAAAHALDIEVFFDIVANHTGDVISYVEGNTYQSKTDHPYLDDTGTAFDDSDYAGTGTFPTLDPATSFPYTPVIAAGDETVKSPAWLNDPIYYHNRGDSTFAGESSLYGDFFGLDDLFTEHHVVQDGLIEIYQDMITNFGIDGFRIDTVKHVNDEFWEAFGPAIVAEADSAGKPDFFSFGEVFDGNPAVTSRFSTELPLDAVLDFPFHGQARAFASVGLETDRLRDLYVNDDWYIDVDSNAYQLPTFLGNHDVGRIGLFLENDNAGAADAELVGRDILAHALMYFGRGMPVIYYGDEQGFTGSGGDKDARQDMFPTQVAQYAGENMIGTSDTPADDNFDQAHPLFTTLAEFDGLLESHDALVNGAQLHRYSEGAAGIYAFSRIERTEQVEYLVVLNNSESADSASFGTDSPSSGFTEIYPGTGGPVAADASGNITVDVDALSLKVYRADAAIPARTVGIPITYTGPADGDEVLGRVEVGAALAEDRFAEVTFAVSVDSGPWTPIGTDDNAPYRVFYDVGDHAPGTEVAFKAIVDDLSGNLASDKGTPAVVGDDTPPPPGTADHAIVHYFRDDGDYGDHTTGNYNDFWGLHLWGGTDETIEWTAPKPFLGEDEYGRFAWIDLAAAGGDIGFIVHRGDTKDGTDADRFFDPAVNPEIWLRQDDGAVYTNQADAQGYVTVHYHRDDGDYGDPTSADSNDFWGLHLWGDAIDPSEGTEWTAPKPPTGTDDFGVYWEVLITDSSQPLNFIIHRGDTKDPGPDQSFVPTDAASIWVQSGDETLFPSQASAENTAVIHYHRTDDDYGDPSSSDYNDFWGMHTWTGAAPPLPGWTDPLRPAGFDVFGATFEIPLVDGATELAYILHRGDEKDPGPDQFLILDDWGYEVWQLEGENPSDPAVPYYVYPLQAGGGTSPGNIAEQGAYWVSENTIVWASADAPGIYELCHAPTGGMTLGDVGVEGGTCIPLTPGAAYPSDVDGFLHLGGFPTLTIDSGDLASVPDILTGQFALQGISGGVRIDATGVQIPGVLDDLYANDADLGVTWAGDTPTISLWAPTAKLVTLQLFDDSDPTGPSTSQAMIRDDDTGIWSVTGNSTWKGGYYLYEVEVFVPSTGQVETNLVTDPYSVSLATNSMLTEIIDLGDITLEPAGWDSVDKPELVNPEDIVLYELHVRDFSISDDTVPSEFAGTYKAFTVDGSDGMTHLENLAEAGLSHVHLLPVFDIATIDEDKTNWQAPDPAVLEGYAPDSEEQQTAVTATEDLDGFNWGYDPLHYTTPEGSYSTDPDGSTRVIEFREMVQSLNETGLRVVMDVVYNHTNASGQSPNSVLDRIVPGYYHRLDDAGVVETSTCCANTATEHEMMERLMVDSLVTWAVEYKVDAFRFDLMGHHSLANMQAVRDALDALTIAEHGVDGSEIYLYGEGWNFGEVADDARFVQATQLNLGGTGIGSFSDRLRDAVRGGGPFDGGDTLVSNQGFINGLYYDPNDMNSGSDDELAKLLLSQDQIRVGLAGNLAAFEFVAADGTLIRGDEVDYNGSPAGYTDDPQENIIYVSAHDNQTLFDISQYKHDNTVAMADRVRAQNVGIDVTLLSQGVPFLHAGVDMLRSKSMDRDSYNSGDWFNVLDFTYEDNNWGVGLPVAGKNQDNWYLMAPLLADPDLDPGMDDILASVEHTQEMLEIRDSTPLFRLTTAVDVQDRVGFHNTGPAQLPGLIVMSIDDSATGVDLDEEADAMWTLFNANDEEQQFTVADLVGEEVELHPVQVASADPIVQTASFDPGTGTFTVPARTTAVFIELGPDTTPPTVMASLLPEKVKKRTGWFEVWYACSDDRDPAPVSYAELNGIPVPLGSRVYLITHPHREDHEWKSNGLYVWGTSFVLTVTCVDESGNGTVVAVEPEFATPPYE